MGREINDFCICYTPADLSGFVQQFNQIRYFKDFRSITSFALCKPIQSERPFLLPRFLKPPEAQVHSEEDVDPRERIVPILLSAGWTPFETRV